MLYNEENAKLLNGEKIKLLTKANRVVSGVLKYTEGDYLEIIHESGTTSMVNKWNIIRLCKECDYPIEQL